MIKFEPNSVFIKVLICCVVCIGTFPASDWSYGIHIDGPLPWVFNYIWSQDLSIGQDFIFPHGPLAFLMYPTAQNVLFVHVILALLKCGLVFQLFELDERKNWFKPVQVLLTVYLISSFKSFNHLLLAEIICLYCLSYSSSRRLWSFLGVFLTIIAFYVKAYVAILALLITVSYLGHGLWTKKYRESFHAFLFLLIGILMTWILMYQNFEGFGNHIIGFFHLAGDNSNAASYYPNNNWIFLIGGIMAALMIPLQKFDTIAQFYLVLTGLSLFAAWKHGMAREDIYHLKGMLFYLILVLAIYLLLQQKRRLLIISLSVCSIVLIYLNINYVAPDQKVKLNLNGWSNFYHFVANHQTLKESNSKKSFENISSNKLPKHILDIVGDALVDVYPWDYSLIPANGLNWQPRKVIHSYAAYTSWLDAQNAAHFESDYAPEYMIWQWDNVTHDIQGSILSSIDGRYLLNDEPQTMIALMSHYKKLADHPRFKLFQRVEHLSASQSELISDGDMVGLDQWIDVPEMHGKGILRIKPNFEPSTAQWLTSFVYKDGQYWIHLKLDCGDVLKYKIVPKNSRDGIWVNPFVMDVDDFRAVTQVKFTVSEMIGEVELMDFTWELIRFDSSDQNVIQNFF